MVRFTSPDRRHTSNYLSRREQWRLLLLIVPLGLVMIVMGRLRDPKTAVRVNQFFTPTAGEPPALAPDVPTSPAYPPASPLKEKPLPSETILSGDASDKNSPVPQAPTTPVASPNNAGLFRGVRAEWLTAVQDNTYFRTAEQDAWFNFLEIVQRTSSEQIESSHSIEANYVQLVDQPDFYRGKLVTVYGYVRQVTEQTPAKNDLGIERYYRIVVQSTDGSYWPIFVYSLELPPGLSVGENAAGGNAKVTGLFFKKLSYQWQGGLGTAPVIVAKSITYHGVAPCGPVMADIHPPVEGATTWDEEKSSAVTTQNNLAEKHQATSTSFRDVLNLAGWSVERLAAFDEGNPFTDEQRMSALELLRRLRSFGSSSLSDWVHNDLSPFEIMKQPDDFRGQLVRLTGRVTKVTPRRPAAADAQRLEMPEYFECEVAPDNTAGTATILTTRIPKAWLSSETLNEPISASALYLKKLGSGEAPTSLWLAKEVAWHPGKPKGSKGELSDPDVSQLFGEKPDPMLGKSILGNLGMDVGQLDLVQPRGRIRQEEREAFYQVLDAVGKANPHTLAQLAKTNLIGVQEFWKDRLISEKDKSRRGLALEAINRAESGSYSAAALFNDPHGQIGQLVAVDGAARRVVRVEVGAAAAGDGASDIARRFGVDHYYEMEVFTDDSQNYPLVFCVRDLPEGFPTGESLHVPVRVAGFFFKDWLYRTRGGKGDQSAELSDTAQYAPLLIGAAPLVIAEDQGSRAGQWIGGGLFLFVLGGICAAAAWFARGDRQFRERTRAASFSLPSGESLNDLHVPPVDELPNLIARSEPGTGDKS